MPEPDLAIVRGKIRDYIDHHPGPDDVALIVEVAASSLSRDRKAKLAVYAGTGFLVHWVVNLVDKRVEVYTDPDMEQRVYRSHQNVGPDEKVTVRLEGRELGQVAVSDMLP